MSTTALYFFFFTPTTPPTGPALSVSPTSLLFATPVDVNPPTQSITIANVGTGSMNWSLTVNGAGISAIPVIGTAPSTVTVSVNVSGLTPGIYNGSILVSAPGASNSPINIPVSIVVGAPVPTLAVSPLMLHFTAQQGTNPPPMLVQVANLGPGTLDWLATVLGPNVTVVPLAGVTPATFQVSINTAGLGVGTHARQIRVDATVVPGPPGEQALFEGVLTMTAGATGALTGAPVATFAAAVVLSVSASSVLDVGPAALRSAVTLRVTTTGGLSSAGNLFTAGATLRITTAGVFTPGEARFASAVTVRINASASTLTVSSPDTIEGFGAGVTGGAGQPIVLVTNLSDTLESDPTISGSLRWAVQQVNAVGGNRRIHFSVSGTINLLDAGLFLNSCQNVTVDGRTSPSGITIERYGLSPFDSSNILIRDLRFRRNVEETDYVGMVGGVFGPLGTSHDIVIDHCSMIGAPFTEPGLGELGDGGCDAKSGTFNVTIQYCLIGVAKQMLIGSTSSDTDPATRRVSIHHCALIAPVDELGEFDPPGGGYADRNPLVRLAGTPSEITVDFRHNIVANVYRNHGTKCEDPAWMNVVGNAYIPAPATSASNREQCIRRVVTGLAVCQLYTSGNVELGSAPRPNLNDNGNIGSPHAAPSITPRTLVDVFNEVGPRFPRDADEQERLDLIAPYAPFT